MTKEEAEQLLGNIYARHCALGALLDALLNAIRLGALDDPIEARMPLPDPPADEAPQQ